MQSTERRLFKLPKRVGNMILRFISRFSLSKKGLLVLYDFAMLNIASASVLLLRFEGDIPQEYMNIFLYSMIPLTAVYISVYTICGLYRSLWQYAGVFELFQVCIASLTAAFCSFVFGIVTNLRFPLSYYILWPIISGFLTGAGRLLYRIARRTEYSLKKKKPGIKRVMIIGAGNAGALIIREMKMNRNFNAVPVVAVDDDPDKLGTLICGVPVEGGSSRIKELASIYKADEIIIAVPSATKKQIAKLVDICKETRKKTRVLPAVHEMIENDPKLNQIRDVSIEDLLGREEVKLNTYEIADYLKNETVLVTGGGGSIGSELCRQIAAYSPKKLVIFDIYENNAYELEQELRRTYGDTLDVQVLIGTVRDKQRLEEVFVQIKPSVVFHAAAHKHVPLMEENPTEAIKNNVFGTLNTALCSDRHRVKKFVLISTDKAVNPTNVMGVTKRISEMIVQSLSKESRTEFAAVRFGNVLGSSGSVIPLFKKQIAEGGPVTVTHKDIIRYFMTIPEAAQLVIQAGAMAKGGEIFILDMGDPVKIDDLARDLIKLSGFEPDVDIKIVYTGLRPGEKLYEELLTKEEGLTHTRHEKIMVGKPSDISFRHLMANLRQLELAMGDPAALRECMAAIVPTYSYVAELAAAEEK